MSSHLSHKLPWHLLVDFVTPRKHPGVHFPVGECNRIHITNKKVELRLKNCKFIEESNICTDSTCTAKPVEKVFYKNSKKQKPFTRRKGGQTFDQEEAKKFKKFMSSLEKAVLEFVQTEMDKPAEDLDYVVDVDRSGLLSVCDDCNEFTTLLEFGDKKKLFEYSDQKIAAIFQCRHGGQAVGTNFPFLMYHIFTFYLSMNIILHANIKQDDWPPGMKPRSYFRSMLLYPCDGQTFLPHSRKYLSEAMIDFEKTKVLNKNLFKFIYFYVMMKMKIDENYSFLDEFSATWYVTRVMY